MPKQKIFQNIFHGKKFHGFTHDTYFMEITSILGFFLIKNILIIKF